MFGQGFNYGFLGKPLCFTDTTDIFKDNSGVALYTLDYDASDSGGATGKFNEGAVFNGSSSRVVVSGLAQPTGDTSVSMWIKFNSIPSGQTEFLDWIGNSSVPTIRINTYDSDDLRFNIGNGQRYISSDSLTITTGIWYHLVASLDRSANAATLYFNGNALGSTITIAGSSSDTEGVFIGCNHDETRFTNGQIDQIRIFNKAISASEVTTLYNETKNTTNTLQILGDTSCIATYPLDGSSIDLSGNYNGTDTNVVYKYDGTPTAVDFGVGGKSLYGARFNGSSSYIDLGASLLSSKSAFSVSTWVKFDNLNTQNFIFYNSESGSGTQLGFYDYGNGNIYFQPDASTSNNRGYISNSGLYTTDEWTHIVMVFDGSATGNSNRLKAYIQGQSITLTYDGTIPSNSGTSTCNSWIGGRASTKFSGKIDQVRIFNKALNSTEVSKLYGNGAGEIACEYTATTTDINYPTTNVAYYKLDNNATDETGSYDGTINGTVNFNFGRFGQSAKMGGTSSDYINLGTISELPTNTQNTVDFSFSCWVKATATELNATSGSNFFFNHSKNSYQLIGFGGNVNGNFPTGRISYYTYGGSGYHNSWIQSSTTYSDGNWHHVVVTDKYNSGTDNRTRTIYVDTVQVAQDTVDKQFNNSASLTTIGTTDINSYGGHIDQVRIFSSALDSDQVTELYNEKPEADTSNFKTVLYEGTSANQYISQVGFDLDVDNGGDGGLVWIKNRDQPDHHVLFDSVRGASKYILSSSTLAESPSYPLTLSSFEKNGFFLGTDATTGGAVNGNNESLVAWVWKGGGDAVTDSTTGDLTADISANTEFGFSIVNFTGVTATPDGVTVPHGLNSAPELVILKPISVTGDWQVYAYPIGNNKRLKLNDTSEATTTTGWDNTHPDSNNVTMEWSSISKEYIMYCFHSVSGYSKIGSYTGTGATGNVINVGFKPRFILLKNTSSGTNGDGWFMFDTIRSGSDIINVNLQAQQADAESGPYAYTITVSNTGFEPTGSFANYTGTNNNGDTYLYMAFK